MECCFCAAQVASVDDAVEQDWIPDYWDGDTNIDRPVCPACAGTMLRFNEEYGDYELACRIVVEGGSQ